MHNVGIVVESLDKAIDFFTVLGMFLEGRSTIDEEWAGRVTGIRGQSVEIAMMVMPDGHGRLELCRYLAPASTLDHRASPANALGYQRIMFNVEGLDALVARLTEHGAELVDEIVQYGNGYRLCYMRGVEGILIGLSESLDTN